MDEHIISPVAIKHAILEALNNAVEQLESSFGITVSDIEKYVEEKNELESELRELVEERNKLLNRLHELGDKINEKNAELESLRKKISSEVLGVPEFKRSVTEILAEYNNIIKTIPVEDIKRKYPGLYKFVSVMSKLRDFEIREEPEIYKVLEHGTRTNDALVYYLVTNYRYAQTGSSKRITITEAARRYGIRTPTLSATIAKLLKKGIIVKVYDPITKKYEYEIRDATTKGKNDMYYRDLSLNIKTYETLVRKAIKSK